VSRKSKQELAKANQSVSSLFLFLPCRLSILAQDLRQVVLHLMAQGSSRWRLKFGLLMENHHFSAKRLL